MDDTMTTERQKAKEQAAVMLAFAEGKKIEARDLRFQTWYPMSSTNTAPFNWYWFDYRIAPNQEPSATPKMLAKLPGGPDKWERVRTGMTADGDYVVRSISVEPLNPINADTIENYEKYGCQIYRRKKDQLPTIPEGYELVPTDSQEFPSVGWKWAREGANCWSDIYEQCHYSCAWHFQCNLFRFIRPIAKPKMPDGIFVVRLGGTTHMTVDTYQQDSVFLSRRTHATTIQELIDIGAEYSHDRITWHKFGA